MLTNARFFAHIQRVLDRVALIKARALALGLNRRAAAQAEYLLTLRDLRIDAEADRRVVAETLRQIRLQIGVW